MATFATLAALVAVRVAPIVVVAMPPVKRRIWQHANLSGDHAAAADDVSNMVAAMATILSLPATTMLGLMISANRLCAASLDGYAVLFLVLTATVLTVLAFFVPPRTFAITARSVLIVALAVTIDVTLQLAPEAYVGGVLCRSVPAASISESATPE